VTRILLAAAVVIAACIVPTTAGAAWSAPELVSFNGAVQGSASDTALAGGGRYVVFSTSAYGLLDQPAPPGTYRVGGLVRRDLVTGAIDLVVPGRLFDAVTHRSIGTGGAATPSVSADGSRVAFIARDGLVPEDDNGRIDVYVRDMTIPWGTPGAVELASAQDGTDAPIGWDPGGAGGAALSHSGGALSDDGRRVVFLSGGDGVIMPGGPVVPAGQVLVRDLDARSTRIVTVARGTGDPVGGAGSATISGDGHAVAWVGANAPAQAAFAAGENADPALQWILWRDLRAGAVAPAVRPAATGDPQVAGCAAGEPGGPACAGRFDLGLETAGFPAPMALSRDGRRVAFITTLRPRDALQVNEFGQADAFVASLEPGRATATAVREITREGERFDSIPDSSPVVGIGLSGDGDTVAFTTARTRFRLSTPILQGAPPVAGVDLETYVVNLPAEELDLVTRAADGGKAVGNDGSADVIPKVSADGTSVAFTSGARNLVAGDVNGQPDSFVVRRAPPPPAAPVAAQDVPAVESGADPVPAYRLRVSLVAGRGGTLRVDARVPGAGTIGVSLRRSGRGSSARRTLTSARRSASAPGLVTLRLRAPAGLRGARPRTVRLDVVARYAPRGTPFAGRAALTRTIPTRLSIPRRARTGA
jgi:hypothetical protein